jgi:predicted neutral ceramidase superfamily lipid hydrolase
MIHHVNLGIHILTGTVAMVIGLLAIIYNRRVAVHRKLGRYFVYLLIVVVTTGFIGFLFFRNDPFLLMLTLIAGYVGYAGYRTVQLREKRGSIWDALIALAVLSTASVYVWYVARQPTSWSPAVVSPLLIALVAVTVYDLTKYFLLHPYLKGWWLYEHIYKMISAFSAMVSAFAGNTLRGFHPYSQIGPSAICMILIIFFIAQRALMKKGKIIVD